VNRLGFIVHPLHGDGLYPFSEEFAGLRPLEPIHRSTFCTRARLAERFRVQAQRAAIARFAGAEGMTLIAEYVEAETGKGADALDRRIQ